MRPLARPRSPRSLAALAAATAAAVGGALLAVPASSAAPSTAPRVDRQEETGLVGFIGSRSGKPIAAAEPGATAGQTATGFLRANAGRLGLGARDSLRVSEQHATATGGRSVRVSQVHDGIPVMGGEFTVNLDHEGAVLSVLGEASPVGRVGTKPAVSRRAAVAAAIGRVARETGVRPSRLDADEPTLTYYDPRLLGATGLYQSARLSWRTQVTADDAPVSHTVVVDAAKGAVSLAFSTIAHARNRVVCDANNSSAQYPCTSPVWTESSQPGGADADVVAAFDYSGDTYDFFSSRFGRDSLDDAGMTLVSTVDYCPPGGGCPYQNAFWDGSQMVYGDGFAVADDVVGHELGHGVTDFSSHLFYYRQSGAINESMSDIFGELIDLTNGAGTDTAGVRWLMGEDIPGIGAIRDMKTPPNHGQPDRMNSPLFHGGEDDNGGVHYNSGVSNKAAYLLTDGATFNGRTVSSIGLNRTARLFYTVNNDLLVSGSDFADLANGMRQACATLAAAGTDGFTSAHCTEVEDAIQATEMDANPVNAPTLEADRCPAGLAPTVVHHDDLESPSGQFTVMPIVGSEVWSYPQNPNDYAGFDATYATSGDTNIFGDNPSATSDSALRMTSAVAIPTDAFLHFEHAFGFENWGDEEFYDGGVLEYSTSGAGGPWLDAGSLLSTPDAAGGYTGTLSTAYGNPLGGRAGFVGESNGYGASRADLAALAGQNVMFRWRIGTDYTVWDYGWFIDDISIVRCLESDTTPPNTTITAGPAQGSTIPTTSTSFSFSSNEPGSTFECTLDDLAPATCTSPHQLTDLAEGQHTFSVVAIDGSGNRDPSPASRTFTVAVPDTTPPDTTITAGPKSKTKKRSATFEFVATEAGSTFQCKLDKGKWNACTSPKTYRVAVGKHTVKVRATDAAGNTDPTPAKWSWTVKKKRR